jgi:3-hydroxy-9,10-secoandrosta-1,3,5(10)-triene-9,17-dione monooxygenase
MDAHEPTTIEQVFIDRARALTAGFVERVDAAEEGRRLPAESIRDLLGAGIARILMPPRFGGHALDFETWLDVVREISKTDASHGWCASLVIHHAHIVAQFTEEAQRAVWADGPDVAIAASFAPRAKARPVDGGYRVSGPSLPFASGVDHSTWLLVGGLAQDAAPSIGAGEPLMFLIPRDQCKIVDTWFTAGMRGTGSNTIVAEDVFVPASRVLPLAQLRLGKGPGGAIHDAAIFRTPFYFYAPLTFAAPMLGAAQGAYEHFRAWTRTRKAQDGASVAEKTSIQVGMARAAADLDAAELLLRRAAHAHCGLPAQWPQLLARSVRDYARTSELIVAAIDALIAMSGSAGFASGHPIERAWRDVHFAVTHIGLNTETNYSHFGRLELGLGPDPGARPFL